MTDGPYNPLDKVNLAQSIKEKLLARDVESLGAVDHIVGAGVYVIYYLGDFPAYAPIAAENAAWPIYVGKAIPKGGRKGGLSKDSSIGHALADRLRQHATSIEECFNLDLAHFHLRHLVVDDVWIPLGENMLIESFRPVWNRAIDGFGNKDPGRRRASQYKSPWDVLHPGRKFAEKLADGGLTEGFLLERVADYFAERPLARLPKKIAEQQDAEKREAEESVDDAEL